MIILNVPIFQDSVKNQKISRIIFLNKSKFFMNVPVARIRMKIHKRLVGMRDYQVEGLHWLMSLYLSWY